MHENVHDCGTRICFLGGLGGGGGLGKSHGMWDSWQYWDSTIMRNPLAPVCKEG